MNKKIAYAIGLMSGTSLDGLDLVYVKFTHDNRYDFQILAADTVKYASNWKDQLKNAIHLDAESLEKLDVNYGLFLGEQVNHFIQKYEITELDFIASHGHTVFHQPDQGITKQIGDGQQIAKVTKQKVVCDFRTQDVKLGGQGAPLVPIGDRLLFADYDACINLGGFANISYEQNDQRIAFDMCPVNVVLNHFSKELGYEYDEGGNLAREGRIHPNVLEQLNQIDFYQQTPPKSLGIEWVHEHVFPLVTQIESPKDVLRTFLEHSAMQIARSIQGFETALFTGGGVFNLFLLERIQKLSSTKIHVPDATMIDYKEALIFAFLGWRKLQNEINCLSSVTGVQYDHSSGVVFNPE
jgi:anhydro-N-acetylmuramic acid kinase